VEDLSEFINFNENKELEVKNMRGLGYSILEEVVKKGFKLPYVFQSLSTTYGQALECLKEKSNLSDEKAKEYMQKYWT